MAITLGFAPDQRGPSNSVSSPKVDSQGIENVKLVLSFILISIIYYVFFFTLGDDSPDYSLPSFDKSHIRPGKYKLSNNF